MSNWDLRDADGDLHDPVWYLDNWATCRDDYMVLLRKDISAMTTDDEEEHMVYLDRLMEALEEAEGYVNKLFGLP